jgi:hypothetical protein
VGLRTRNTATTRHLHKLAHYYIFSALILNVRLVCVLHSLLEGKVSEGYSNYSHPHEYVTGLRIRSVLPEPHVHIYNNLYNKYESNLWSDCNAQNDL